LPGKLNLVETKLCFLLLSNLSSGKKAPRVEEVIATEGAGILNWSLEGLARLKERGRFEVPAVIESATQGWKEWAEEEAEREHKRGAFRAKLGAVEKDPRAALEGMG